MFDEPDSDLGFPPEDEEGSEEHGEKVQVALVSTRDAVPLSVQLINDERTPEEMVCVGTYFGDRLIARRVVPPEVHEEMRALSVFSEPVRVALAVAERPPGLQCQLFALVPAEAMQEDAEEGPEEPWAASVPRYEDAVSESEDGEEGNPLMAVPLGQIVRFEKNRKHPDDLSQEAADILQTVLDHEQKLSEIVDKVLEELLGEVRDSDEFEPPNAEESDPENKGEV